MHTACRLLPSRHTVPVSARARRCGIPLADDQSLLVDADGRRQLLDVCSWCHQWPYLLVSFRSSSSGRVRGWPGSSPGRAKLVPVLQPMERQSCPALGRTDRREPLLVLIEQPAVFPAARHEAGRQPCSSKNSRVPGTADVSMSPPIVDTDDKRRIAAVAMLKHSASGSIRPHHSGGSRNASTVHRCRFAPRMLPDAAATNWPIAQNVTHEE